ncbi:hypothetical protein BB560_006533, partial [Smittium megazygosporum]
MYRIQFNNFILNAVFDGHNSEIVSTSKNHYLNSYTDVKKEIQPIFYTVDSQGNIFVWNAVSFSKALFYSLELDILHNDDLQIHCFSAETNSWTLSHKPKELKNNVDELVLVPDTINSNFISSQKSEFKSGNSYTIIFLNKGEASAEIYRVEYLQNSTIETKFMGFQQLTLGHKKVEFDFVFSTYHNSLNLPGGQKDVLFYTFLQKNSVFIGWELANSENRVRAQPKCAYNLSWNNMIYNMQSGINNEILFISEFSDKKNGQQRSIFSVPLPFVDYFSIDNKELYSESEKEHSPKTSIEPLFISRVCSNASDMLIQPGNHEALLSVLNNIDTIDIFYTTHLKSSRPKLYNIGTLSLGKLESRLRNFMFLDIRKSAFVTDNKIHIMIFNRNASVKKTPVLQEIKGQTENIKDIKIKEDISISNTTVDSQDSGSINQLNEGNLNNEAKATESGITNPSCTFESVNKQYESIGTNLLKRINTNELCSINLTGILLKLIEWNESKKAHDFCSKLFNLLKVHVKGEKGSGEADYKNAEFEIPQDLLFSLFVCEKDSKIDENSSSNTLKNEHEIVDDRFAEFSLDDDFNDSKEAEEDSLDYLKAKIRGITDQDYKSVCSLYKVLEEQEKKHTGLDTFGADVSMEEESVGKSIEDGMILYLDSMYANGYFKDQPSTDGSLLKGRDEVFLRSINSLIETGNLMMVPYAIERFSSNEYIDDAIPSRGKVSSNQSRGLGLFDDVGGNKENEMIYSGVLNMGTFGSNSFGIDQDYSMATGMFDPQAFGLNIGNQKSKSSETKSYDQTQQKKQSSKEFGQTVGRIQGREERMLSIAAKELIWSKYGKVMDDIFCLKLADFEKSEEKRKPDQKYKSDNREVFEEYLNKWAKMSSQEIQQ